MSLHQEQMRYPLRIVAGVAAAALLAVWGSFTFYQTETAYQQDNRDPYRIAAQFQRLGPVLSAVPENAVMGYVTDAEPGSVVDSALLGGAVYVLAPRLVPGYGARLGIGQFHAARGFRRDWKEPGTPSATELRQRRRSFP